MVRSGYIVYNNSCNSILLVDSKLKAMSCLWDTLVPSKIIVFGWRCIRDRIATRDHLVRRGIISNDRDKVCVFCFGDLETLDHLMVSCPFTRMVWRRIFSWIGLDYVNSHDIVEHLLRFWELLVGKVCPRIFC